MSPPSRKICCKVGHDNSDDAYLAGLLGVRFHAYGDTASQRRVVERHMASYHPIIGRGQTLHPTLDRRSFRTTITLADCSSSSSSGSIGADDVCYVPSKVDVNV